MSQAASRPPKWASRVLFAAGIYNLVWGAAVIAAPLAIFRWAGMQEPTYPQIWQCVGMIVGVYGVGNLIAARDPFNHWPIVLVGFLGKVLGPIGFLHAVLSGSLPWTWGVTIITNDLIWWVPFAAILYGAFRHRTDTSQGTAPAELPQALREFRSHRGATLQEISHQAPALVIFLRHSGCTFCRESLANLESAVATEATTNLSLAIVHMGRPLDGAALLENRNLPNVHRFSDPQCHLYRAFGLSRGAFGQLFAPSIVVRGLRALIRGHGIGRLVGDGFRMPGAFALVDGEVVAAYRSQTADDHPDFVDLIKAATLVWRSRRAPKRNVSSALLTHGAADARIMLS